ncbi:DNA polymerase IV [Candidatus Omnitrophota bacterium]
MSKEQFIVHIDMDAFFAAVEQRDDPSLCGKPVVIGADPKRGKGRGVVSTCSYEARAFGIRSAMPISEAYRRCPGGIFLLPQMEKYAKVSHELMRILYDFSPQIEPISIDEAFIDITGSYHLFGSPRETCLTMKERIRNELQLTASIGLAPIKMAAKIASDLEKPDGLVIVNKEGLIDFLWPLTIDRLWGVGKKTETLLRNHGMRTIGDVAKKDVKELQGLAGASGVHIWQLANGIDERDVELDDEIQSVSNEYTFENDTNDRSNMERTLLKLCEKVSGRLRSDNIRGKTITLRIRFKDFTTYTRSITLPEVTNYVDVVYLQILQLLDKIMLQYPRKKFVRLLGVKVSKLAGDTESVDLFDNHASSKRERIHAAIDTIVQRFGDGAIQRARTLPQINNPGK